MSQQPCPSRETLADFAMGRLDLAGIEDVSRHLEECQPCAETLGTLKINDTLLGAIQQQPTDDRTADPAIRDLLSRVQSLADTLDTEHENVPLSERLTCLRPAESADELGRLGCYRILQVIGIGGMGTVFLAEHLEHRRTVALKVMRPGLSESATGRKRFLREIQALAAQDHSAIVPVLDVGEDNGVPFFAMPLLRGETLESRLKRENCLPFMEAVRIARDIASGLVAAHERGLVHRDVKPANVFLCQADNAPSTTDQTTAMAPATQVKLMDFGLARLDGSASWQTQAGTVLGTPHYMAPEQIEGAEVDARADAFSLGCVLFRMVTGQLPFTGRNHMKVLVSVTRDTPASVTTINPEVPPRLALLIQRLLAKDRELRPQSLHDVCDELNKIAFGSEMTSEEVVSFPPDSAKQKPHSWKRLSAVASLCAVIALGVYWRSLTQPGERLVDQSKGAASDLVRDRAKIVAITNKSPNDSNSDSSNIVAGIMWQRGPADSHLHGLVARPTSLKGIKRWQLETVQPRCQLHDLQWSPDGKWMAIADSRQLRVYKFSQGELTLFHIFSDGARIDSLSWSPDSERIVVSYHGSEPRPYGLRVWNVRTGMAEQAAPLPDWWSARHAWSPNGRWLATVAPVGGGQGKLSLYKMPELMLDQELPSRFQNPQCVCWSPDSTTVAVGGNIDSSIELWKLDGTSSLYTAVRDGPVLALSWSPDGQWIAAGGRGTLQLISPTGELGAACERFESVVKTITWSPNSGRLIIGGNGVAIWEDVSKPTLRALAPGNGYSQFLTAWHPDGRYVAFGQTHSARMWLYDANDSTKSPRPVIEPHPIVSIPRLPRNGNTLAFGASDGSVRVQHADGSIRVVIQHRLSGQWALDPPFEKFNWDAGPWVAWTASGRQLASQLQRDSFLRVWNSERPTSPSRSLPVGASPYYRMFARGERVIRGDEGVHELDLESGDIIRRWTQKSIDFFSISPDGQLAAIFIEGSKVTILRLADGKELATIDGPSPMDSTFSWSNDGRLLAIGAQGSFELWNARTWQRLWRTSVIGYSRVATAPDGSAVLSTNGIHDIETGRLRAPLAIPATGEFALQSSPFAWYPDSQHFVSNTDNLIAVHSAKDASVERTVVPILPDFTLVFDAAGNLEQGDLTLLDHECVCIIEQTDGTLEIKIPSQFLRQHAGMASWPTARGIPNNSTVDAAPSH